MIYTDSNDSGRLREGETKTFGGEETGFMDNLVASFKLDQALETTYSEALQHSRAMNNLLEEIQAIPGHEDALDKVRARVLEDENLKFMTPMGEQQMPYDPFTMFAPNIQPKQNPTQDMVGIQKYELQENAAERMFNEIENYVKENEDVKSVIGEFNRQRIKDDAIKLTHQAMQEQADVYRKATGTGVVGSFVGTMGAVLTDPVNVAAIIATRKPAVGWFKNALREGVASAAAEGVIQKTTVEDWYKELGLDYTYKDFMARVGVAGGAGLVFGGGAEFISEKLRKSLEKIDRQRAEMNGMPYDPDQDAEVMFNYFKLHTEIDAENPVKFDFGISHIARQNKAYNALITGDFSQLPEPSVIVPRTYDNPFHYDLRQPNTELVDISSVGLAPELFQPKRTKKAPKPLEISRWDPRKANTAVIYQYADGTRVVVDGHRRAAAAKKMKAKDKKQKFMMPAIILKEHHGITPEQAKARGAGKNLAEGTITKAELDDLYKEMANIASKMPAKPSTLIANVQYKLNLSDKVNVRVSGGEIPLDQGLIIGRLISDDNLQEIALNILKKKKPATLPQAEAIVRDVLARGKKTMDFKKTFGEDVLPDDLYKQKARLIERTVQLIINDRNVMKALNKSLNLENLKRNETYGKIAQIIYNNAFQSGQIAEAITNAAKRLNNRNFEKVSRELAEDVRGRIEQRDYAGLPDGTDIVNSSTTKGRSTGDEELDGNLDNFNPENPSEKIAATKAIREQLNAEPKVLDSFVTVDDIDVDGNVITRSVALKDLLDEVDSGAKDFSVLERCSRGS